MKIGINQWAFPEGMPAKQAMNLAKEIGFESFEVCVGDEGPTSIDASEDEIRGLRQHAGNIGMTLHSVGSGMGWKFPLSSPDAAVRAQGIEATKKGLQIANWLGAGTLLVVPGVVTPEVSYDVALENAIQSIRELIPVAEANKVMLGIENVWNKFLLSPVEMRDFIDQFDSDWAGAYFDIGNIILYGYSEQWIRILGRRICAIHAKDFRASAGNFDGFVALLEGDVNWPEVIAALEAIGFDGPPYRRVRPLPPLARGHAQALRDRAPDDCRHERAAAINGPFSAVFASRRPFRIDFVSTWQIPSTEKESTVRVLVAEDDAVSRQVLLTSLKNCDYEITSVQNGAAALDILRGSDTPRLVILDWMMPEMDGISVIEEAAFLPHRDLMYIILLTVLDCKEDIVKGLEAGADDYVVKPFDSHELHARLQVGQRFIALRANLEARMKELEDAARHIKTLQGILPICMYCRRVMPENGDWEELERYVQRHMDADFSHGICPECRQKYYPELENARKNRD